MRTKIGAANTVTASRTGRTRVRSDAALAIVIDSDRCRSVQYFDAILLYEPNLMWMRMLSMDNICEVEASVFFPRRRDPVEMTIKIRDLAPQISLGLW